METDSLKTTADVSTADSVTETALTADDGATCTDSAAEREGAGQALAELARLEEQLCEKDELVAVLTERLEQAAEQLDRFRRTGSGRGVRLASGLPTELVDSQKSLITKLEHAVAQWEDLQAAAALGRLEMASLGVA